MALPAGEQGRFTAIDAGARRGRQPQLINERYARMDGKQRATSG